MELKKCTKCGENKPNTNEYFAYSNKSKGILRPSCKVCDKKYREKNKDKRKEYIKEYNKNYYENNKDKIKSYYEYKKKYHKKYRENNKDKMKEYTHKRSALELGNGGSYTKAQWLDTLEYFDYKENV